MASHPTVQEPAFEVVTASLENSQVPVLLRNRLHPLLPHSLPLYRRCQFHFDRQRHQRQDEAVSKPTKPEVWIALSRPQTNSTAPVSATLSSDWLAPWLTEPPSEPGTSDATYWIATHIDLTEPGQTQIWTFASWEPHGIPTTFSPVPAATTQRQCDLFQTLYTHLRTHHIPHLSPQPSRQWLTLQSTGKILSVPYSRNKVLFGTLSEVLWWTHEDWVVRGGKVPAHGLVDLRGAIAREDRPYLKYLMPRPQSWPSSVAATAPPGFQFRPLKPRHLQTMLDRSVIPRTLELLRTLVSVGLFPDGGGEPEPEPEPEPVAWGILGKDASVSSLHTEDEYRGRGFAEAVVRELLRRLDEGEGFGGVRPDGAGLDQGEGEGWPAVKYAHTDVDPKNLASRRVFEKMGAQVGWRVGWFEVDLGLAESGEGDRRTG